MNIALNDSTKTIERPKPVSVNRQLLWFAFVIIAVSGALVAWQLNYLRNQAIATGERSTQAFVHIVEEQTARTFQSIDQQLELTGEIVTRGDTAGGMTEQAARQMLKERLKGFPFLRAIWVLDREGRIKYNSDEGNIGLNLADRDYFQIYRSQPQTALFIGKPVRSRTNGSWLTSAARPLRSLTGEVTGVIVAALDASYFEGLWRKTDLGSDGVIALWRRDGLLMMRSPPDNEAMGKDLTAIPLFAMALPNSPTGIYTVNSATDGKLRTYSFRTLHDYPELISTAGQSFDVILQPWRDFAEMVAAIWAMASVLILALCFFLHQLSRQRNAAEQNATDLAQRLALATDAAAIGIWDWDVSANHWFATAMCFKMLGEDTGDGVRIDEPWIDRVHPEDRDAVNGKMRQVLDGEASTYTYDARLRHADGSYRWIRVDGRLMARDHSGKASRILGIRMDITANKEAELLLRDQLADNSALISAIPDLIFTNDRDGTFVSVHARNVTELLVRPEVFLGHKLQDILPVPVAERVMCAFETALASGTKQIIEYSLVVAGVSREYEARIVPRDKDSLLTIVRNVTERKLAEAELVDSERRHRALVDWSPEPLCVYRDGRIIYVNPAACNMIGADCIDDIIGTPILDVIHPDSRQVVLAHLQSVAAGSAALPMVEMKLLRLDGAILDVEVQSALINYDGEPAMHVSMRDVTERNRSSMAVRESEVRFRSVWESSVDGMRLCDAPGRIVSVNPAYCAMVETSSDALEGHSLAEAYAPAEGERILQRFVSNVGAGTIDEYFERELTLRSGDKRWFAVSNSPLYSADGSILVLSMFRDISARKQAEAARESLEAQLRQSQKMEAIGTLAGGIAHDFNNILATILGNTELARQDMSSDSPALASLAEIKKAGSRARDLVRQILSFSRREPARRSLISLTPSVDAAASLLRATLPARLTLNVHCDADVPLVVADPTQIQQVIINLVTNAMQATRDGSGRIDVRLSVGIIDASLSSTQPSLQAFYKRAQRMVQLCISDDGPGMDAATQARVFEPFFTTKAVNEGTGLGLSVVHGIVSAHDGVIIVESEVGKGARFSIYLPIPDAIAPAVATAASLTEAALEPITDAGKHILYVDDDEALVLLVRRLLERRGYHTHGHTDQREALAELRTDPARFDLVVTDYNMPGMSGLDVARAVRDIRADLPVVIASGFIDETLRVQSVGAGVRELIFKASAVEDMCDAFVRLAKATQANVCS